MMTDTNNLERGIDQIERADLLVERVLDQLTNAIVTGHLSPQDKLVETRLADQLGVSRGPVREAFRRLEQMGLVEKIPYRGTYVATLSDHDIVELHTVRAPLEGLAARLLAEQHDPQRLARLEAIIEEMRQVAGANDASRMVELDLDFHDGLIEQTEHKLLGEVWQTVSIRLRRFLLLKRHRLYHTLSEAAALHEPIVQAIAAGDPARAESLARRHVEDAARDISSLQPDDRGR